MSITMQTVKNFCYENFNNVEDNIFNIIEKDLEDKMVLIKFKRFDIPNAVENIVLIEEELYNIIKDVDYVYEIEIVDDIKKKIEMMEKKINFDENERSYVNMFLTKISLVCLTDGNERFLKYLENHCRDINNDLINYSKIIKNGWIKPKFDCLDIILGKSFDF